MTQAEEFAAPFSSYLNGSFERSPADHAATAKKAKWKFCSNGTVFGSPTLGSDAVIFGSADHHVYKLHLSSGREIWRCEQTFLRAIWKEHALDWRGMLRCFGLKTDDCVLQDEAWRHCRGLGCGVQGRG